MENSPGQRLRQWRDFKKLTLAQVSEATGVKTTTLSTTEQPGANNPSYDTIAKVLLAFPDLSPDWLLLGAGQMLRDGRALTPTVAVEAAEPAVSYAPVMEVSHRTPEPDMVQRLLNGLSTMQQKLEAKDADHKAELKECRKEARKDLMDLARHWTWVVNDKERQIAECKARIYELEVAAGLRQPAQEAAPAPTPATTKAAGIGFQIPMRVDRNRDFIRQPEEAEEEVFSLCLAA